MNRNTAILGTLTGIGTGAAVMYFLDPDRGARRRALVRDKVNSKALRASRALSATKEDLTNRGYGMVMEAKTLVGLRDSDKKTHEVTRTGETENDTPDEPDP